MEESSSSASTEGVGDTKEASDAGICLPGSGLLDFGLLRGGSLPCFFEQH